MSWQRLNIGSRVNREVHARFWEQPEVKSFRLTRLVMQAGVSYTKGAPFQLSGKIKIETNAAS